MFVDNHVAAHGSTLSTLLKALDVFVIVLVCAFVLANDRFSQVTYVGMCLCAYACHMAMRDRTIEARK